MKRPMHAGAWPAVMDSLILVICAVVLAASAACSRAPEADGPLVATYRNGVVTAADYDLWIEARKLSEPPRDPRPEIEQLVMVRALAANAVSQGLDTRPELAFQLQLIEDRSLQAAFDRRAAESVSISEDEVSAMAAANPDAFSRPKRVRLYNIFKRFQPGATDEDRKRLRRRMEDIRRTILAGGDFEEIALAESDSETRYRGGRMGVIARGELPPAVDAIVMNMSEDEISEILESAEGLTILKCGGVFDAEQSTPEEVRQKIETNLLRSRRREDHDRRTRETLRGSGLEIDMERALDPSTAGDEVVARFGPHALTRAQLDWIVASRRSANRQSAPLNESVVRDSIGMYVVTVLTADMARESDMDDDTILAGVRIQQQRTLATEELRRRVQARLVEPTEAEQKTYFETHRDEFQHPRRVDLMMIGFVLGKGNAQAVHTEARTALAAIDTGELSFENALRMYSDLEVTDPLTVTLTPPQLAVFGGAVGNAVRGLSPGQVSRIIRQDDRLWIVKLVDRRPPRPLSFAEAGDTVRRRLGQERVDTLTAEIERSVIDEQQITLVDDVH